MRSICSPRRMRPPSCAIWSKTNSHGQVFEFPRLWFITSYHKDESFGRDSFRGFGLGQPTKMVYQIKQQNDSLFCVHALGV